MMDKEQTCQFLRDMGIEFERVDHPAVCNMAEMAKIDLPHPEAEAKNLFLRDDRREHFFLLTVRGDRRVDLKEFRRARQTRPLRFASEDELSSLLGLIPGAVTPLGVLNDVEHHVKFFLDRAFAGGLVGVHPNDNTATLRGPLSDLLALFQDRAVPYRFVDMDVAPAQ